MWHTAVLLYLETGELTVTKPGWFNYESVIQSFREFIKTKPCPDGKKYCIILDNAPWHKKAIRLIWTEALQSIPISGKIWNTYHCRRISRFKSN